MENKQDGKVIKEKGKGGREEGGEPGENEAEDGVGHDEADEVEDDEVARL